MKRSAIFLRLTICFFALYTVTTACSAASRRSRGTRQSIVMTPEAKEAYEQRRTQGSEQRRSAMNFDASLDAALSNPAQWARDFVTIYEMPDWERQYTGQQVNELIDTMENFLVSLKSANTKIALIKGLNKIPDTLAPRIQTTLKARVKAWKDAIKQALAQEYPLEFVATTANILGSFDDPFEFDGDYGATSNATRKKVFDLIVSNEAKIKNLPDSVIKNMGSPRESLVFAAATNDRLAGPTLEEVVTPKLLAQIKEKLQALKVAQQDIDALEQFINKYRYERIFYFMRNNPPDILNLEKTLKDDASKKGKNFDLPVLGSKKILTGNNGLELKKNLADAVFTNEVISKANPTFKDKKDGNKIKPITANIDSLKPGFLSGFLKNGDNKDLYAFCTPAGLAFFYWLYQALIFDLIAENPSLIEEINTVKATFAATLGDPQKRATVFRQRLVSAGSKLLFTQEADKHTLDILIEDKLFLPIGEQNDADGTVILLKSDFWEPEFEIIPFNEYTKYKDGKLTAILATQKNTQQKFLLASGHGHSEEAQDGRQQMQLVAKKLAQLIEERDEEIFLIIGVDANTKKKTDVQAFQNTLAELGLVSTQVGPTTIKKRMVTVQHGKAGLSAIDEEDYLIVKKDQLVLSNATVGFGKPGTKADVNVSLPNVNNQSDHYAVSALVQSKQAASTAATRKEEPLKTAPLSEPQITQIQQLKKTVTLPAHTFTQTELAPESEERVVEPKPRRSALKKENSPKKGVKWADESGVQLKEEREPEKDVTIETLAQKKSPSSGGRLKHKIS